MYNSFNRNDYIEKRFTKWQFEMNIAVYIRLFGSPDYKTGYIELGLPNKLTISQNIKISGVRIQIQSCLNDILASLSNGYNPSLQYYNAITDTWYHTGALSVENAKLILHSLSNLPIKYIRSK